MKNFPAAKEVNIDYTKTAILEQLKKKGKVERYGAALWKSTTVYILKRTNVFLTIGIL